MLCLPGLFGIVVILEGQFVALEVDGADLAGGQLGAVVAADPDDPEQRFADRTRMGQRTGAVDEGGAGTLGGRVVLVE